ncbi:TetR/AcrR family transcriptional regulator [Methylacidiphilum caldifontis]|uniref:TetR family transcriptional regulator n=1 Tax=Methylacidiphilum caldifontis TaxID=2795386 RepID=A0A4Y8PF41_9BACT|nr:TetR/AcrR family transcriptional regulator [Methylacidiphilum caldifontis]QSR88331.1 TetR/AcrR family transcriptional regulator [Methylacidiphilum caldifontis]TFE70642.1 TetR family transcriptional regulator [Methylacidiphilum caldifontis]
MDKAREIPTGKIKILAAAKRLFAQKGFEGTTTRMIAQAAHVNEALIYRYYPTKKDLYSEIIRLKIEELNILTENLAHPEQNPESIPKFLKNIAIQFFSSVKDDPDFLRLLYFSALERHELSKMFCNCFVLEIRKRLEDYVSHLIERNIFKRLNPYLISSAFIGIISHYLVVNTLFELDDRQIQENEIIDNFIEIFLDGVVQKKK